MRQLLRACFLTALVLCMVLTATAANSSFTPSVEYKGAPDILEAVDAEGNSVLPQIIVTPYSRRSTLPSHHREVFIRAYGKVNTDEMYQMLKDGGYRMPGQSRVAPMPLAVGGMRAAGQKTETLVVTDLFYVHEKDDMGMIQPPVTVTYDTHLPAHAYVQVFEFVAEKWRPVASTLNDDGTVTTKVNQWGPYAIVTDTYKESSAVKSPQTGVTSPIGVGAGVAVLTALAARKRKQK